MTHSTPISLNTPIFLIQKTRILNSTGEWTEIRALPLRAWASLKSLPPLADISHQSKGLKARAPTENLWKERYEVTLRERPSLSQLAEVIWGHKVLTPLTGPQLMTTPGYVSFQATVLRETPKEEVA